MSGPAYPTQGKPPYGYPEQSQTMANAPYPSQPSPYPTMNNAYPPQVQQYPMQPPFSAPAGPPPPYSRAPGPGQYPVASGYPTYQPQVVPQAAQVGSFDAAARFGAGSTYNIPPPPPGVAPTAAQVASMQGQPVVMQQRQAGWFSGPPGGGTTFW